MSFQVYLEHIQTILNHALASGNASLIEFRADPQSTHTGYLAGILQFEKGSQLHFREYVDTGQATIRLMYAYHFQNAAKQLIFRYDNATHRPALPQPEHKHTHEGVIPATAPTLQEVLDEITGQSSTQQEAP